MSYETRTIIHYRVVSSDGGIPYSSTTLEDAEKWLGRFNGLGPNGPYHLETWEQKYKISLSTWRLVDSTSTPTATARYVCSNVT